MKKVKTSPRSSVEADDIPEVDFSKGVRGKHYKRYLASMVSVEIEPDVAQQFHDSASANEGLRELLKRRREQ
jgi:hypothetical protein